MFVGYVLTLTGSAQRLSSVLIDATPGSVYDRPLKALTLQPFGTNLSAIYVGHDNTVAAGTAGLELLPGDANSLPPGPYQMEPTNAPLKLSQIWVTGANGEKLRIGAWQL